MEIINTLLELFLHRHSTIQDCSSRNDNTQPHDEIHSLENKKHLKNVLDTVRSLAEGQNDSSSDKKAIFYIIKIYTDKINCKHNTDLLESEDKHFSEEDHFLSCFGGLAEAKKVTEEYNFQIQMGKSPIITGVWSKDKLITQLIEREPNSFRANYNHTYFVLLPLGITLVANGNHSINSCIVKAGGQLDCTTGGKGSVYDISPFYDKYYFDGNGYREIHSDRYVCDAEFEFGCLFEIGRILVEENINYLDYFGTISDEGTNI